MRLRIDPHDRVSHVSQDWAELAALSGASHLLPKAKVGKPYREFVEKTAVAEIFRNLFERVRLTREVVRFTARADNAYHRRFVGMEIEAVDAGAIELRIHVIDEGARAPADWKPPPEEDEIIRMCTFCQRAQWDFDWLPVEQVISEADLFGENSYWELSHGSCPDCLQRRLEEIKQ